MELKNVLNNLGLTEKESSVYLALLEIGQSSVLQLAKKSAIKRPTVYVTLDSLVEKGLVLTIPKGRNTTYQAIEPDEFLNKFEKKVEIFKQVLPELKTISNASPTKPKVRFYEGKKNILDLYENEIFSAKKILGITSIEKFTKKFSQKELDLLAGLLKYNKGEIKDLLEDSLQAREYIKEKNKLNLGESKFLPENTHFDVDLLIYGDFVAMISFDTMMAVVIEDRAITTAQKILFETLWASTEKPFKQSRT